MVLAVEEYKRNKETRDIAGVKPVTVLMRRMLEWCGHVCRRNKEDIKRTSNINIEGKKKRKTKTLVGK